jgi:hypothetical protein
MTQLLGRDSVSVVVHSLRMDVSRGCAKMKPTAIFIAMYHFEKQSLRGGHPGCTGGVGWPLLGVAGATRQIASERRIAGG